MLLPNPSLHGLGIQPWRSTPPPGRWSPSPRHWSPSPNRLPFIRTRVVYRSDRSMVARPQRGTSFMPAVAASILLPRPTSDGLFPKIPIRMKGPSLRQRLFAMAEVMEIRCELGLATSSFVPVKVMSPPEIGSEKAANQWSLDHLSSLLVVTKNPLGFEVKFPINPEIGKLLGCRYDSDICKMKAARISLGPVEVIKPVGDSKSQPPEFHGGCGKGRVARPPSLLMKFPDKGGCKAARVWKWAWVLGPELNFKPTDVTV